MLSALDPLKGTLDLIAALATPEVRRREWTATLAGNGPVEQLPERRGCTRAVRSDQTYRGGRRLSEVRVLLDDADILLLPSRSEGLPMSILEAMASGVAVISTPVGAIPDAIIDGETGLLVPPGDVPALSHAIFRLLDDPALRHRLAVRTRGARFERMFTIERTADSVAAVYQIWGSVGVRNRPAPDTLR